MDLNITIENLKMIIDHIKFNKEFIQLLDRQLKIKDPDVLQVISQVSNTHAQCIECIEHLIHAHGYLKFLCGYDHSDPSVLVVSEEEYVKMKYVLDNPDNVKATDAMKELLSRMPKE